MPEHGDLLVCQGSLDAIGVVAKAIVVLVGIFDGSGLGGSFGVRDILEYASSEGLKVFLLMA